MKKIDIMQYTQILFEQYTKENFPIRNMSHELAATLDISDRMARDYVRVVTNSDAKSPLACLWDGSIFF